MAAIKAMTFPSSTPMNALKHRGIRAASLSLGRRQGAPVAKGRVRFNARAEILWSLQPTDPKAEPFVGMTYPVSLTEVINKKRPGPNQTGSLFIGAEQSSSDLVIHLPTVSEMHAEIEEVIFRRFCRGID